MMTHEKPNEAAPKQSSESILGMIEPPEYQCPRIDAQIEKIAQAISICRSARRMGDIDASTLDDVECQIYSVNDELNSLRFAIDELRAWGFEWKKLAKELIAEYEPELLRPKNEDE